VGRLIKVKVHMLALYKIKKHSHRNKLHLLVIVLYDSALLNISQLILCSMFLLASCYLLTSV